MYEAKNYEHLLGLSGFSDDLLNNHFGLYNGYVTNTNKALEQMKELPTDSSSFAEISRRFGWEYNGMRLHELYFGGMGKDGGELTEDGALGKKIAQEFGSLDNWRENFLAKGAMRGIGWVILCHDQEEDHLFNVWINEHDMGHLAGAKPLLVMDVFEHAFVLDYGVDRKAYINAFMDAIDWSVVESRFS